MHILHVLICAQNLCFAQKLCKKGKNFLRSLEPQKLLQKPKVSQKLPSTIRTALLVVHHLSFLFFIFSGRMEKHQRDWSSKENQKWQQACGCDSVFPARKLDKREGSFQEECASNTWEGEGWGDWKACFFGINWFCFHCWNLLSISFLKAFPTKTKNWTTFSIFQARF